MPIMRYEVRNGTETSELNHYEIHQLLSDASTTTETYLQEKSEQNEAKQNSDKRDCP